MSQQEITVLGAGNMGTALAQVVATNGHHVRLWSIEHDVLEDVRDNHHNTKYLEGVKLHENIEPYWELLPAIEDARLVIVSVPSQVVRTMAKDVGPLIKPGQLVLNVAKGLEADSHLRMSEILFQELDEQCSPYVGSMGGPAIAIEMAKGQPLAIIIAFADKEGLGAVQGLLQNNHLKVATTQDVTGLELCATLKNVYAIALGMADGVGHGTNMKAFLASVALDEMERQVKILKIDAWKMYTGAELGEKPWFMDDEKVAYPFWERTRKLGVTNLCVHKGLPLGFFHEKACQPLDLEKAAKDWPDLNFIVYHSGFRGYGLLARGTGEKVVDPASRDPQEIPWISDILRILKRNPQIKNIYFELGSTWNGLSGGLGGRDVPAMHFFGQVLALPGGEDRIIWGTDSIWGGSPQSQIERFRRFQISDEVAEKFGYKKLTKDDKATVPATRAATRRPSTSPHAAAVSGATAATSDVGRSPDSWYSFVMSGESRLLLVTGAQAVAAMVTASPVYPLKKNA